MLAVVSADGIGTDDRCQGIGRIRKLDEREHSSSVKVNVNLSEVFQL